MPRHLRNEPEAEDWPSKGRRHQWRIGQTPHIGRNRLIIVQALAEMDNAEDKQMFMEEYKMTEPALNRLIRSAYKLLNLDTYFTAGVQEVRAWTITQGFTAPQAAGVIHSDFEKGFIRANVISFNDFVEHKSEAAAKSAGVMRTEGKEYVVQEGDVLHFLFNV